MLGIGIGFQNVKQRQFKENFVGKVSGSVVENPHSAKRNSSPTLILPSGSNVEFDDSTRYAPIRSLDGAVATQTTPTSGNMSQHLFSFNLIAAVERKNGSIGTTTAEKVQWLKDNLSKVTCNWHGFGSSPTGNKATFTFFNVVGNAYWSGYTHANGTISKLTATLTGKANTDAVVDANGFVHYLAYAEPSNGTTASTINTDYVELEIELK